MCGIYGHIKQGGKTNSAHVCIDGLKRLEYRGYDSAGLAGVHEGGIVSYKTVGKVHFLDKIVQEQDVFLDMAIAHTRWATHGGITETNAHPHYDAHKSVALVHNGIIENYATLKKELVDAGIFFSSETDTEVISQLISFHYEGNLQKALETTLPKLDGSFAIAMIHKDYPGTILAATRGCPLAVGVCKATKDIFLSSDSNAFIGKSLSVFYLLDDEYVVITSEGVTFYNKEGQKLDKEAETLELSDEPTAKEGFDHFLLKEIYEQPSSVQRTFQDRIDLKEGSAHFKELSLTDQELATVERILILACGSSYHAGSIAKHIFESYASIPTEVEIASEFRYHNPIISKNTLVIAISQSGETADTLAAVKEAKRRGSSVIALCNVKRSTLSRIASSTLWLHAGPEISVCSTKAFTSQLSLLMLLALKIGRLKTLDLASGREFLSHMQDLPDQISSVLSLSPEIESLAKKYCHFQQFFFIGRNYMYATSLEAALKLKEISYINASAYPAGEMKHGPIALISKELATIAFCGNTHTFEKLLSNLMEIKARGGPILAFAPKGLTPIYSVTEDVIFLPNSLKDPFAPIPYAVVGQLLAYHIARLLGTDIDQPRNLAKSVTVE